MSHHAAWELHGAAVERTVLSDERAAVDANDLMGGESLLNGVAGEDIRFRLSVGRHEHTAVENEKIGIGGRQSGAVVRIGDG